MANGPLFPLIRHLRRSLERTGVSVLGDAELLQRWLDQRDEAAFEVLLWRHGAMVLGVCRRLLHNTQQIEDAFQATFLILVRKAASLRTRSSLASWLYKIAYRIALHSRTSDSRRHQGEQPGREPMVEGDDDLLWRDLRPVLDEEINHLPERYRSAFVLCYLQGKTNAEAARELGCPVGTILSRLAWARERLRGKLTRRGVTLSGALLASLWPQLADAAVTSGLIRTTLGLTTTGVVPVTVNSLVKGVLQAMVWTRIKLLTMLFLCVGVLTTATGLFYRAQAGDTALSPARPAAVDPAQPGPAIKGVNVINVPSQRDGILAVVGTEIKEGERIAPSQVIKIRMEGKEVRYRKLREGDKVEEGQLLARLDDEMARNDLAIAAAKIEASKADLRASEKTGEEAKHRYDAMTRARVAERGTVSDDDYRGVRLTWDRYVEEASAKKQDVTIAQLQHKSAATVLRMHEIRSPVSGTILRILKKRGEGVKALETVFQIEIAEEK